MKPSIGRMVHWTWYDRKGLKPVCRAAVITEVNDDGSVTLFPLQAGAREVENVLQTAEGEQPGQLGTWHEPERV